MSPPSILPKLRHTATVIFLHGLGDTGHGWCESFEEIALPYVKYIFPNAPSQPVTLNFGMVMPSWFDIRSLDHGGDDEDGIKRASDQLKQLIQAEESVGIASDRIVIGGFSQGGALAFYTGLLYPKKLGGVVGLSTWLPLHSKFEKSALGPSKDSPFFQGHGTADPLVKFSYGQQTHAELKRLGCTKALFNSYNGMPHSSCAKEMEDVKKFLAKALPEQK